MPELPEVEIIRLGLAKRIKGLEIRDIEVLSPASFQADGKKIEGKKVLNVWRKAKILGIDLTGNLTLLIHLKMSGQLIFTGRGQRLIGGHPTADMAGQMPNQSTRLIFTFSDGSKLYFNDQRRFGWIKVLQTQQVAEEDFFKRLGPEPLNAEFDWQTLKERLNRHKGLPVKVALMDQSLVSGIGNIYDNEALFNAGINPAREVLSLSDGDYKKLFRGIVKSLADGLRHGGSTIAHFVNSEGKKGYFLSYAYVYGRGGDACKRCGTTIKKIQLGGRGTYFCPNCQK